MVKSFSGWITETKELPFDKKHKVGWWQDGQDGHLVLFHGTHKRNVDSVLKHGINKPDPSTGMFSTSPDPHTAHGYASMSGAGGEGHFRQIAKAKLKSNAEHTPHEDRVVFKLHIPKEWAEKHMDHDLKGNLGDSRKRMLDRNEYAKHKGHDSEYYAASEVRFKKAIPAKFIHSYSFKVKK